jgi:hypothetical protein
LTCDFWAENDKLKIRTGVTAIKSIALAFLVTSRKSFCGADMRFLLGCWVWAGYNPAAPQKYHLVEAGKGLREEGL